MTHFKLLSALLTLGLLIGCQGENAETTKTEKENKTKAGEGGGHSHGAGPHGGAMADFGKYHTEFTVDHDKKQATVYIVEGADNDPAPIAAEMLTLSIKDPQLTTELKPEPMDGEEDGMSSRFVGTHDGLATVQEYEGTISGELDGKPYSGDFKEEPEED